MGKQRLKKLFENKPENLLSIYLTAGYPELNAMPKIAKTLEYSGVDFIEAGMPYSDPLADGPTIQHSSKVALKNGMNLKLYFDQIKQIRKETGMPILFMGYFNQVLKTGIDQFLNRCVTAGIDALIIPDLSPEIYQAKYQQIFEKYDLSLVFLISPTTSVERIKLIDSLTTGFIYVVSSSATTGQTTDFDDSHIAYFEQLKQMQLNNPSIIAFGIDTKEKFNTACRYANGAIIGSAFIKAIKQDGYLLKAGEFVTKIIKE